MRHERLTALVTTGCLHLATPVAAQEMFVLLRGEDTIAVERVARTPSRLDGETLSRVLGIRFTWALTLSEGQAVKLENEFRQPADDPAAPPAQRAVLAFVRDTVLVEIMGAGGQSQVQRLGTRPGALPYLNPSFAMLEPGIARLLAAGSDSLSIPHFMIQGGQTLEVRFLRRGPDSVTVTFAPGQDSHLQVDARGRIQGGRVPAQGLTLVRTEATGAAFFVPRPDYSAPPGAPYRAEQVEIRTPMGHTLAGTLTLPEGDGPFPAVVTITGSGAQDRDEELAFVRGYRPFRQIADTLGRMGIAVLRMDDRGFGGSGGDAATATTRDLADDIRAGLVWLRSRADIDGNRLGLVGHSEGGIIAPMLAAEDPGLAAIVLMAAPSQTGRRIITMQQRYAIEHAPTIRPEARDSALEAAQRQLDSAAAATAWLGFFLDYDPLPVAGRIRSPTLILHGATDRQVAAADAEELAAAIRRGGNPRVEVRVFPETNHLFLEDASGNPSGYSRLAGGIRPEVIEVLTAWLARTLRP